jgi:hypothetical protein
VGIFIYVPEAVEASTREHGCRRLSFALCDYLRQKVLFGDLRGALLSIAVMLVGR